MAFILLDESGDLGFDFSKKGTTNYFLITLLFTSNKRSIEKCVKKTYLTLRKKFKRKGGFLHANKEKAATRRRFFQYLSGRDYKVLIIYLNKKKVYTKLQNEKSVLYNYVTNILLDRIFSKKLIPLEEKIKLIASKKETNKFLNENFKNYLKSQVRNIHKINLEISIKTPFEEKALQGVDFVSWAIFRKYEFGDDTYYKLIKKQIAEESPLFP